MQIVRASASEAVRDPRFQTIIRARRGLRLGFSIATLVLFFGFVFAISTAAVADVAKLTVGGIPVEMIAAFGLIVLVVLMTGFYVLWSNSRMDPLVEDLRREHRS
jgi:uncharacterized membrane protein (DUF485 family)